MLTEQYCHGEKMRIATKRSRDYPWYVRVFFYLQKRRFGKVLQPSYVWGRIPRLFFAMAFFYSSISKKRSAISPELRSLVMVRVSQINDCAFCLDLNSAFYLANSKHVNGSDKLNDLQNWQDSSDYSDLEKLCLLYAESMTITGNKVTDELTKRLQQHLSDDDIVELTAVVAYQNLSSKFNNAIDVSSQEFCAR